MDKLGKGIGIGLTALAIAFAIYITKEPDIAWAFIILMFMSANWD